MKHLGCYYEAPTFGAHYPDGTCIDGYMWDLDSCDEPGGGLCDGGDQPCPWCNTVEFLEYSDVRFTGNAHQRRIARRIEVKKARAWAEKRSSLPPAAGNVPTAPQPKEQSNAVCRSDGKCQYAIDHDAEKLGHCPTGKCVMPRQAETALQPKGGV